MECLAYLGYCFFVDPSGSADALMTAIKGGQNEIRFSPASHSLNALSVQRGRRIDRKEGVTNRNVYLVYAFGQQGCGKVCHALEC